MKMAHLCTTEFACACSMLGPTHPALSQEGDPAMTRNAKLTIATIATALVATFGVVGTTASTAAPVNKGGGAVMMKDRSWCC